MKTRTLLQIAISAMLLASTSVLANDGKKHHPHEEKKEAKCDCMDGEECKKECHEYKHDKHSEHKKHEKEGEKAKSEK